MAPVVGVGGESAADVDTACICAGVDLTSGDVDTAWVCAGVDRTRGAVEVIFSEVGVVAILLAVVAADVVVVDEAVDVETCTGCVGDGGDGVIVMSGGVCHGDGLNDDSVNMAAGVGV